MEIGSINSLAGIIGVHPLWIALAVVWTLTWKGLALWRSAGLRQKYWFIALLVVNTLGILEIIYLYFVSRKYELEIIDQTK